MNEADALNILSQALAPSKHLIIVITMWSSGIWFFRTWESATMDIFVWECCACFLFLNELWWRRIEGMRRNRRVKEEAGKEGWRKGREGKRKGGRSYFTAMGCKVSWKVSQCSSFLDQKRWCSERISLPRWPSGPLAPPMLILSSWFVGLSSDDGWSRKQKPKDLHQLRSQSGGFHTSCLQSDPWRITLFFLNKQKMLCSQRRLSETSASTAEKLGWRKPQQDKASGQGTWSCHSPRRPQNQGSLSTLCANLGAVRTQPFHSIHPLSPAEEEYTSPWCKIPVPWQGCLMWARVWTNGSSSTPLVRAQTDAAKLVGKQLDRLKQKLAFLDANQTHSEIPSHTCYVGYHPKRGEKKR